MDVINLDDSVDTHSMPTASASTSVKALRKKKKLNIKNKRREIDVVQVTDSDATLSASSCRSSTFNLKKKRKRRVKKKRLSIVILDSDDEPTTTKESNKKNSKTDSAVIEISDSEGEGVVSGLIETTKQRNWKTNQNITCIIPTTKDCNKNNNNNITRKNERNTNSNNNKAVELTTPLKNISLLKNNVNLKKMRKGSSNKTLSKVITSESSSKIVAVNETQNILSQESLCSKSKSTRNSISYQPEDSKIKTNGLRPIIIDGSNVAFGHGKERFSAKGIQICIEYFIRRNHKEIRAFIPQFRRRHPATIGFHVLDQLEKDGYLIYTPSRQVEGRRITSYDDRFIVEYAAKTGGVIITRDNYCDLLQENRSWSDAINYRVLQYTFVGDMIMFPPDPLGQGGPTLDEFLKY